MASVSLEMAALQQELAKIRAGALGEIAEAVNSMRPGIDSDLLSAVTTGPGAEIFRGDSVLRESATSGGFEEIEGREEEEEEESVQYEEEADICHSLRSLSPTTNDTHATTCETPPSLRRGSAYGTSGKVGEPRRRCAPPS